MTQVDTKQKFQPYRAFWLLNYYCPSECVYCGIEEFVKEKPLDPDKIAAIEKAISKKYGKEAVQNPKGNWNEEKEKEYTKQVKKFAQKHQRVERMSEMVEVDGIFIEIGADPRIDLAKQLNIELNDIDEIVVDKMGRTNVNGILAAGDVTDASGDLKQTITAASQGALAATASYEWVSAHPNACEWHAKNVA